MQSYSDCYYYYYYLDHSQSATAAAVAHFEWRCAWSPRRVAAVVAVKRPHYYCEKGVTCSYRKGWMEYSYGNIYKCDAVSVVDGLYR